MRPAARALAALGLAAMGLLPTGCEVPNRAPVFEAYRGTIAVKLTLPPVLGTTAAFTLDDRPLAPDADAADGYDVVIDTTAHADGLHALGVRILDAEGRTVRTLAHTLRFDNAPVSP